MGMPKGLWGVAIVAALAGCTGSSGPLDPASGKDAAPDYAAVFGGDTLLEIALDIAPEALAVMDEVTYVHGTFRCGSTTLRDVGVRYKGNSSYRNPGPKKSFKVDFNRYVPGQHFFGFKKLNFNNNFKDPSMMREKLAYDLHQTAGVPAPCTAHANLTLNGSLQGVYTVVEQVDRTFLETRFSDDGGNLFKATGFECNLGYRGGDGEVYAKDYELKTNEEEADWSGFVRFVNVLNNTPDADFPAGIQAVFQVDPFLSWLAVDAFLSHLDNYAGTGHNFYLYENPADGRFVFIPWDANEEFGNFRGGWSADALLALDVYAPFLRPPSLPGLKGLWGAGPNDVIAVGDGGNAARYDGSAWTPQHTGTNRPLNALWRAGPNNAFAVGEGGEIRRFDGANWAPQPSGTAVRLNGVFGVGPSAVFAVGDLATVLRFDGAAWTTLRGGTGPPLFAVWGSSATDVFAVGGGPILHYDGTAWTPTPPPFPPPPPNPPLLFGLWGFGPANVVAVGEGGTVIRYNGTNWIAQPSGSPATLRDVWGPAANDLFAVGDGGTILHWNGASWSSMASGTAEPLLAVWGAAGDDVFACGGAGTILHYDGAAWTAQDAGFVLPPPAPRPLVDRILAVPEYRAVYEAKFHALLDGPFTQASMDGAVDALFARIRWSVYADPLKAFTDQQFDESIGQDIPPTGPDRILGLKPFVTRRRTAVLAQLP